MVSVGGGEAERLESVSGIYLFISSQFYDRSGDLPSVNNPAW